MPPDTTTGPAGAPPVPRAGRVRRAILSIPESDLANLVKLAPHRRIVGIRTDPMRMAAEILVEGDDLPELVEGAEPPHANDLLRYRPPQLVDRVDVDGWPAPHVHATVLGALLDLMDHAGHIGHAAGVVPDLSVNAHATWIGAHQIVTRHAPYPAGEQTWCSSPGCQDSGTPWPCADYVAAALGVVVGLEAAEHG